MLLDNQICSVKWTARYISVRNLYYSFSSVWLPNLEAYYEWNVLNEFLKQDENYKSKQIYYNICNSIG